MAEEPRIRCRDECGASVADLDAALHAGWTHLHITSSWRCSSCARALAAAGAITGTDGVTADTLPPDSRGALPRETASTITPPTFRG